MLNLFAAAIISSPSVVEKRVLDREEIKKYKIIKFRFPPKLPSIRINQKCLMGVGSLHMSYSLNINGGLGTSPQRLATLEIYYQNKPFLGMLQPNFYLNTFETCLLLSVCILKFSILAIILLEYLLLHPSTKRGPKLSRRLKNSRNARAPCHLLLAPMGPLQP